LVPEENRTMPRPIWTGAISFGLVNVPVKLFSAVSQKEVRFHMLHDKDGARIKQKRVCAEDGEEVPYEHIVKGYEVSKDKYVMITREELEKFDPKSTSSIDIEDFVQLDEIDPIFYESSYHLVPDKGAAKVYALLFHAMQKTGKVGIARMVMRTKQYLCCVRPMEKGLMLSTMLYADEVNPQSEIEGMPSSEAKPKEKELEMAEQLIASLTSKFEPSKYKDDYRERVLELIEKKAEGEEIVEVSQEPSPTKVVNLMDALKRSLAAAEKGGKDRGEVRHRSQAARTAKEPKPKKRRKSG
jgi:DNA end-binding protein Ku